MSKISDVNETSLIPSKLNATNNTNNIGVEIDDTGITLKKDLLTTPSYVKLTQEGFNINGSDIVPYQKLQNLQNNIKFDSNNNIGIGLNANATPTGSNSIAIGTSAGEIAQTTESIAIGNRSGYCGQFHESIAIGPYTGYINQKARAIAIGQSAGFENQYNGIAIGRYAGQTNQNGGIAIGTASARYNQATNTIAVGWNSGNTGQSSFAISMGTNSGYYSQGQNAIAIGRSSGFSGQGVNSIYIGSSNTNNSTSQHSNSIVLNATGIPLNTTTDNSSYLTPIRNMYNNSMLQYNTTTKEITYNSMNTITGSITLETISGTFTTNPTYTLNEYKYSNYGNMIFFQGQVSLSNKGDASEGLSISGLPIDIKNGYCVGKLYINDMIDYIDLRCKSQGTDSTKFNLEKRDSTSSLWTPILLSDLTDTSEITFNITYAS